MLEAYQELSSTLSPFPCLAQDFNSWEALQSYDYSLEKIRDPFKEKKNKNYIHGKCFYMNLFAGEMFMSVGLKSSLCLQSAVSISTDFPPKRAAVLARLGLISLAAKCVREGMDTQAPYFPVSWLPDSFSPRGVTFWH